MASPGRCPPGTRDLRGSKAEKEELEQWPLTVKGVPAAAHWSSMKHQESDTQRLRIATPPRPQLPAGPAQRWQERPMGAHALHHKRGSAGRTRGCARRSIWNPFPAITPRHSGVGARVWAAAAAAPRGARSSSDPPTRLLFLQGVGVMGAAAQRGGEGLRGRGQPRARHQWHRPATGTLAERRRCPLTSLHRRSAYNIRAPTCGCAAQFRAATASRV